MLPDRPLPLHGPELEERVREDLQRCDLSLHMLGTRYGVIPEAAERSVIDLPHLLAMERREDPSFTRLLWQPMGAEVAEERQQAFLQALQDDPAVHQGAEFLQVSLEDLKTIIQDKITTRQQPPAAPKTDAGPRQIYIICDPRDVDLVAPLDDYLYDQGFDVYLPAMDGDEAQIREDHIEQLKLCDASIIFYGHANDLWLRAKLRDWQKIPGYGRTEPMLAKAIYVAGPETDQKQRVRAPRDVLVMTQFADFSPDVLRPFIDALASDREGEGT